SSSPACHRQREPLPFTLLNRKRASHDVRRRGRRDAQRDGARSAFSERRERSAGLFRFAPAFARRNERENSGTRETIEKIRRSERADHTGYRQSTLCPKRI